MKLLTSINDRLNDMAQECAWPSLWKISVVVCFISFVALVAIGVHKF